MASKRNNDPGPISELATPGVNFIDHVATPGVNSRPGSVSPGPHPDQLTITLDAGCGKDDASVQTKPKHYENRYADVLGGHLTSPWVRFHKKPRPSEHCFHRPQLDQWCHIREGISIPMPSDKVLHDMTTEFYQRTEGQPVGPVTEAWTNETFARANALKRSLFNQKDQVTGLWAQAENRFKRRLKYLPKKMFKTLLREITQGFDHPFRKMPKQNIFSMHNHPNLSEKPEAVVNALRVQLRECSIQPWDWLSRGQPKGIYSMRWVEKSGTTAIRLTLNGRPLNRSFAKDDVSIVLETHADLRERYAKGMMFMGFDLHHGFYNACYSDDATTWVCFRIGATEITQADADNLRESYPNAWKDDHIYFCYKGLVMGLSPSCRQLTKVIDALMIQWRRCPVKGIAWDIIIIISAIFKLTKQKLTSLNLRSMG